MIVVTNGTMSFVSGSAWSVGLILTFATDADLGWDSQLSALMRRLDSRLTAHTTIDLCGYQVASDVQAELFYINHR